MLDFRYCNLVGYACELSILSAAERYYHATDRMEWRYWLAALRERQQVVGNYIEVIFNGPNWL